MDVLHPFNTWLPLKGKTLVIAGPCSVESEEQMLKTARGIATSNIASALRGGVWKPRTKPGSFEGIGVPALHWLKQAGNEVNLPVLTEVANALHVEEALKAGIDMLWIGARTTVNPFYVQEIADALQGVDIPVLVKNPIHPEVGLWAGALERLNSRGIKKLGAIHRGFYSYQSNPFRNEPKWEVSFELRRLAPDIPIICDPSHIAGKRSLIKEVCQSGLDLGMDGFMIETHCNPDKALSDAAQQITPLQLADIIESLETRSELIDDQRFIVQLEELRGQIDKLDHQLLDVLRERVKLVESISDVKAQNQVKIFQMKRWFKILENREKYGSGLGLDPHIVHELFQLVHKYSIDVQIQAQQKESSLK
ncbi:MAG: chorismate mutase [Owenweeksia sp.]